MTRTLVPWRCFEDEVYIAVKSALSTGYFPLAGKLEVKRGATYSTTNGGNVIKIEVAVEAFRKDATEPFLIWLWECKHKDSREVEVGDVRELYSKIQEIGAGRAKGSIVTTLGFQSGAVKLAISYGISLYLLKKELAPVTKYSKELKTDMHEVITACHSIDFSGKERDETWFADLVRYGIRQSIE